MEPNFFIKYKGTDKQNDSNIDLTILGESIIGFDHVIKEIFNISKIKGEISVNATKSREGSLIMDVLITIGNIANTIPFDKISDFLNFLRIVDQEVWAQANQFFNTIGGLNEDINAFARQYPATYDLIKSWITLFIGILIGKAEKHKTNPDIDDLPKNYAIALHKMIKQGKFKKALRPFIENEILSIELSSDKKFNKKSVIDTNNFEKYLSEDEKILPEYENGEIYIFSGTIVAMQCSRGDSMKIRIHGFPKKYRDLVAIPPAGKSTIDFDDFYGQTVITKVLIERKSLYQKPILHIQEINLQQQALL